MGSANGSVTIGRSPRSLVAALAVVSLGNAAALAVHEAPARLAEDPAQSQAASVEAAPTSTSAVLPGPAASNGRSKPQRPSSTTTTVASLADSIPLMAEGFDFEMVLEPKCAKAGQRFTATLRLKPGTASSGAFMPIYADGTYEDGTGAIAKEDGTASYSWTARDVPGEGRLVIQARDAESDTYGRKIVAFRIVRITESC